MTPIPTLYFLFLFSGRICFLFRSLLGISLQYCAVQSAETFCLKSPRSCKGLFFVRDCRPEQLSTVTEAAHCSVPLWLPLLHYCIHLTLWLPDKQMQSKLSRNKCIVFLFTSGECGDNEEKNKNIFIVLKILLFPDLLFVHCVTFRETENVEQWCVSVGCVQVFDLLFSFLLRLVGFENQQGCWATGGLTDEPEIKGLDSTSSAQTLLQTKKKADL